MAAKTPNRRPSLGLSWRAQWHRGSKREQVEVRNDGKFDELVVDSWFHLEQMNSNFYWVRVGDHVLNVARKADSSVVVTHEIDP